MILIEITQVQTKARNAKVFENNQLTDKTEERIDQMVKVHNLYVGGFRSEDPRASQITLERGAQPYQPGLYSISDESFRVSQFNRLEMGALKLIPFDIVTIEQDFKLVRAMIEVKKKLMAQAFAEASKAA